MSFDVQIVVDSSSPHTLADWWAEALGWQVEPQDEAFIRRLVEAGAAAGSDTTRHRGALVWKVGAAIVSPEPGRPRVLFQLVPEAKTVKNRLHLDVRVGPEGAEAEVARLVGLGAGAVARPAGALRLGDPRRPGGQRVLRRLTAGPLPGQLARRSRASLRSATARSASSRMRTRRRLRSRPR